MIPQDYHMHTHFSPDSDATMESMCEAAINLGIAQIGFTEHHDLHPREENRNWFKPAPWFAEIERCRALYAGRLIIRAGIEIGEPHLFQSETKAILDSYPFDYALGSLHWVGEQTIFDPKYFTTRRPDDAWRLFFEELEQMTSIGGFDSLSHLDVPMRVGFDVYGEYDPTRYADVIRPVLKNCIEQGIALDLNTAAFRRKAKQLTPGLQILTWYAEMGGERITLGSDAHRPTAIGMMLDTALDIARAAGLRYVTQFEQRKATLLPI